MKALKDGVHCEKNQPLLKYQRKHLGSMCIIFHGDQQSLKMVHIVPIDFCRDQRNSYVFVRELLSSLTVILNGA